MSTSANNSNGTPRTKRRPRGPHTFEEHVMTELHEDPNIIWTRLLDAVLGPDSDIAELASRTSGPPTREPPTSSNGRV